MFIADKFTRSPALKTFHCQVEPLLVIKLKEHNRLKPLMNASPIALVLTRGLNLFTDVSSQCPKFFFATFCCLRHHSLILLFFCDSVDLD